ncbi:MAG: cysteine desulfurase [Xanthomonadales bacterium]|nr:cysteine desulfurase [Xanthomonadales bacterium]
MSGVAQESRALAPLDVAAVRAQFPVLSREVHGRPLVYLDTAASAQRPLAVIDAVNKHERTRHANVHRGVHTLSQESTEAYEGARDRVARHINARDRREVVFTRGTTESVNLVAQAFLRPRLREGDRVVVSLMEHHSNIVPWQILCRQTGAELVAAPINDRGELLLDELERLLDERVKLLGVVAVSNALGTVNPVPEIATLARRHGIPLLVDGAQAMPHQQVDVQALGCDFFCFSGHKMYAPTGIGGLWARGELLDAMPPWQGGGEMIRTVSFEEGTEFAEPPARFEAGTPNISGAVGLGAAVDWLDGLGMDAIAAHEADVLAYGTGRLQEIDGLRLVGTARNKAGVLSFVIDGIHPHDIGTIIDHHGVAIRTGHHCAMPVIRRFGLPATARASLGVYNTREDIDALVDALRATQKMFA